MRTRRIHTAALASSLLLAMVFVLPQSARSAPSAPDSGWRNSWQAIYPNSDSYSNASCEMCHSDAGSFSSNFNGYGWQLYLNDQAGMSRMASILAAENLDSDSDPTGSTNLEEIDADTQPGWTPGPNNTNYKTNGQHVPNQLPPSGISGELDPSTGLGTSYCSPANPNSSGSPAVITADGSATVSDNDVTLTASDLPPGQFGYFLVGRTQGSFTPPGSQGVICLSGDIGRYNQAPTVPAGEIIVGPTGSLTIDLTDLPTNTPGSQVVMAGETINFQCWYRDSNPMTTSNFTDGLTIVFQ